MDQITDPQLKINRLTELNVLEQCTNLIKTAAVQEAYLEYGLTVHGWVFDIYCGRIIDLKIDYPKILKEIMKIYDLTQ
jgi:carbonic anhydrase